MAVQVLGGLESGHRAGESGWVRLVDAETGDLIERRVDAATWSVYRSAVEAWSDQVRAAVWGVEGRWVRVEAAAPLDEALVRDLRRQGLIT